jgi:pimeloyl-ACP methyl ester carboxylesterase
VQPKPSTRGWGGDRIAYQVLGDGPPDLVVTPGSFGHVDIIWEDPGMVLFFQTLASLSRLILFDRRGTGASDPLPLDSLPPWESHAHDLAAVLDEVGSQGAALLARLEAGPLALFSPAPGRSAPAGLILANTTAKYIAADDYPIGVPPAAAEALFGQIDQLWGSEAMAAMGVPSRAGNERFLRWMAKLQRSVASSSRAASWVAGQATSAAATNRRAAPMCSGRPGNRRAPCCTQAQGPVGPCTASYPAAGAPSGRSGAVHPRAGTVAVA